jgi:hypothetical protein
MITSTEREAHASVSHRAPLSFFISMDLSSVLASTNSEKKKAEIRQS